MYLNDTSENDSLPYDIKDLSPEMTREFRGLRVWFPIKLLGAKAFRDQLEYKIKLAQWACQQLSNIKYIRIIAPPQLSTFAFKIQIKNSPESMDSLNRLFLNKINQKGHILLSPFSEKDRPGTYAIRMNILSFRTDKKRIELGIEDIKSAIKEVMCED
ncbi:MAG: decarboxylase [Candidatus Magnetoglobus multicellularis str. Araruama]|uniref:Decarboxylase n=1 Tax=Candidatus Magnetoglobus multicellularis str. Araruama TaxID=890399 RepID=A0A1V1P8E9_9BACT|nr:MAG: decarboxylase [Candidatus Magnetoglobus multicellularis str. Araruama]